MQENFKPFHGVVEDVNDPDQAGRVRVRAFGFHSPDPSEIPTDTLPWAGMVMPVTSASSGGIGTSATGILPGSWVFGFFRDGDECQDPVILGTLPSKSTLPAKGSPTFADPSGTYPLRDGTDLPAAADSLRYKSSPSYLKKTSLQRDDVKIATKAPVTTLDPNETQEERGSWAFPKTEDEVAPVYPHNKVTQSPSGHTFEVDDTPGRERISQLHASGTFHEIVADGSERVVIVGKSFTVIMSDKNLYVEGDVNLTVKGSVRTLVKGDYILEVEGDMHEHIKGSRKTKIGNSEFVEIGQEQALNIGSARKIAVATNDTLNVGGSQEESVKGDRKLTTGGSTQDLTSGDRKEATGGDSLAAASGKVEVSSGGNMSLDSGGSSTMKAASTMDVEAGGAMAIDAGGAMSLDAPTIDLNE